MSRISDLEKRCLEATERAADWRQRCENHESTLHLLYGLVAIADKVDLFYDGNDHDDIDAVCNILGAIMKLKEKQEWYV